jgi:transposase
MKTIEKEALKNKIDLTLPILNEYQKRMYLASEAKAIGYGGISLISQISGVTIKTIRSGIRELTDPNREPMQDGKSRRSGGGRKRVVDKQPNILNHLQILIEPHTKGDPERALLWTNKALMTLAEELQKEGFTVSHVTVGEMLEELGYSLQSNKKSLALKPSHPDRNEQFEYINKEVVEANDKGCPVLSIDAKKKENVGNFKNNGTAYELKGCPTEVLDHDFPIEELGKATPYGVYNVFKNVGFVNVGISKDTASFAVESIRRWWYHEGIAAYSSSPEIVITADCGGSNGNRNRLWKLELQNLANEIGKPIRVLHYPPGCSKWNKIEHRLFSFISSNWRGIPLVTTVVIIALIGATTTRTGLAVKCVLDEAIYEKGIKVCDDEFDSINIIRDDFHGEWNYRIAPAV